MISSTQSSNNDFLWTTSILTASNAMWQYGQLDLHHPERTLRRDLYLEHHSSPPDVQRREIAAELLLPTTAACLHSSSITSQKPRWSTEVRA